MILAFLLLIQAPCQTFIRAVHSEEFKQKLESARSRSVGQSDVMVDWIFAAELVNLNIEQELIWLDLWKEVKRK